tara:strand:+ start:1739 stop:2065 length:327 start_codon:yes stop_codon:yes gene_type:complete
MTKEEVQKFRGDFQSAVVNLEKQYGVNISLGTIGFDVNGLSAKMKAEKGEKIIRATKDDFQVGDIVGINHKKVNKNDEYEIVKINNKNIKVVGDKGYINVSPGLLVKK